MIAKLTAVAALALASFGSFAHAATDMAPTPASTVTCSAGYEAVYDIGFGAWECVLADFPHGGQG